MIRYKDICVFSLCKIHFLICCLNLFFIFWGLGVFSILSPSHYRCRPIFPMHSKNCSPREFLALALLLSKILMGFPIFAGNSCSSRISALCFALLCIFVWFLSFGALVLLAFCGTEFAVSALRIGYLGFCDCWFYVDFICN
jgi:hypothetical protein